MSRRQKRNQLASMAGTTSCIAVCDPISRLTPIPWLRMHTSSSAQRSTVIRTMTWTTPTFGSLILKRISWSRRTASFLSMTSIRLSRIWLGSSLTVSTLDVWASFSKNSCYWTERNKREKGSRCFERLRGSFKSTICGKLWTLRGKSRCYQRLKMSESILSNISALMVIWYHWGSRRCSVALYRGRGIIRQPSYSITYGLRSYR